MVSDLHPHKRRYPRYYQAYKFIDIISASVSWFLFFCYRKIEETPSEYFTWDDIFLDSKLYLGVAIVPLAWSALYHICDHYYAIFRHSRALIFLQTLYQSIFGVFLLLLTLLVDDDVLGYRSYLYSFFILLGIHVAITYLSRWLYLTYLKQKLNSGRIAFRTLLIGNEKRVKPIVEELQSRPHLGMNIVDQTFDLKRGGHDQESQVIRKIYKHIENNQIDEVFFLLDHNNGQWLQKLANLLYPLQNIVQLNTLALASDIPTAYEKSAIPFTEIIRLRPKQLSKWKLHFKRGIDILISVLALVLLLPVMAYLAIRIATESDGPVVFKQSRVGHLAQEFTIYKFRSMKVGAEKEGPQLSSKNDDRCTPFGTFMRKWRIDEIPQFWNVIKGDMSLVGPRPERQYYIDQLRSLEPQYDLILTVRPGITSMGQVKYGYASDLEEMRKRLRFDLIYVQNQSLFLDFKILFGTIGVLIKGVGK